VENIVGSTGLELKSDPGVPLVYAGFGALMITTLISYVSHSQVSTTLLLTLPMELA
jgi:cytochrome c biogenesis protein